MNIMFWSFHVKLCPEIFVTEKLTGAIYNFVGLHEAIVFWKLSLHINNIKLISEEWSGVFKTGFYLK